MFCRGICEQSTKGFKMENDTEMSSGINDLDDETLQELYTWIDEIPLSRPKRNIARDFSDGGSVLVAEIVGHFLPKLVEIHNYSAANSVTQKKDNWTTFQRKVMARLDYRVSDDLVDGICKCRAGTIEIFLVNLRNKIDKYLAKKRAATLRKQHQVYDEFSSSAISDVLSFGKDEDYSYGGSGNNFGFPFNTAPQQEVTRNPNSLPNPQQYHQGSYYEQQISNAAVPQSGNIHAAKRQTNTDTRHLGRKPPQPGAKHQKTQPDIAQLTTRLLLEEKEQSLLASQETIQILQVKVRRLEHLLHLKDIRIEDLSRRLQQVTQPPPKHLPPQQNPPVPPISGAAGQPLPRMHSTPPLPPVRSPPNYSY